MPPPPGRRPDIDWLRVFATYMLFVFHSAMIFAPFPFYHVTNADRSLAFGIPAGFISQWHMPLFFLLSGWSVMASLTSRGAGGFARERVQRLFVPLLFGCAILAPPIKYAELLGGQNLNFWGLGKLEGFDQSFPAFLPEFFTRLEYFSWSHLWFIAYLFTFAMLYRPLLAWISRRSFSARAPGAVLVYAPILPLALVQIFLRPHWPGLQNLVDDWANFAYYSLYFLRGFLLARFPTLERRAHAEWRRAGTIAVVSLLALWYAAMKLQDQQALILALTAAAGWCSVVTLLGLARKGVQRSGPVLGYLSATAFPVYLLHQSAVVFVGYFVVKTSLGMGIKYAVIVLAAVPLTLAVCHFLIRPLGWLRFLTGMKPGPAEGPLITQRPSGATPDHGTGARRRPRRTSWDSTEGMSTRG